MHHLVVAHDLYPDPGSGGTGRYVYETGRRLVDRGHDVTVLTRRRGDVGETGTVAGMEVCRVDLAIDGEPWWSIARQLPSAASSIREHLDAIDRPDVVSFQATALEPLVDALLPDDVPRSATFHSPWPVEYRIKAEHRDRPSKLRRRLNERVRRRLERRVLARCRQTIVLSPFMGERLRDVHGPAADPDVVPGGVDPRAFTPEAGDDERLERASPALLTVRRLSPRMGHRELLAAFSRVVDEHPGAELFLAGDGPLREALERRIRELGVDERVHLLGYVPDERLPGLLASADVFVLPTQRLEGFGLATLEALASGTPVAATPVGATPDVLEPFAAAGPPADPLADGRDPRALAEAIRDWLELSPVERAKAGELARRVAVERYAWETVVDELEAAYQRLRG